MKLKELSQILQGSQKFTLQSRDDTNNIVNLDEVFIYEIQYLPASLLRREVLRIELDESIIFLDRNRNEEEGVKKYVEIDAVEDYRENSINIMYEDGNLI